MNGVQQGCQYPGCQYAGIITFALVPLCLGHYTKIIDETHWYYEETIEHHQRCHYNKINHLIPWRNKGYFFKTPGKKEKPL